MADAHCLWSRQHAYCPRALISLWELVSVFLVLLEWYISCLPLSLWCLRFLQITLWRQGRVQLEFLSSKTWNPGLIIGEQKKSSGLDYSSSSWARFPGNFCSCSEFFLSLLFSSLLWAAPHPPVNLSCLESRSVYLQSPGTEPLYNIGRNLSVSLQARSSKGLWFWKSESVRF